MDVAGSKRVVLIIPTLGRKQVVNRLLGHLERQHRLPDHVIVSAPDASHVEPYRSERFEVSYIFGPPGLCGQRNRALDRALPAAGIVTFIDDDFLPADDYLARVVQCFDALPEAAAIMGHVVVDGAHGAELSFEEGLMALRAAEASQVDTDGKAEHIGTYGCNMSIRADIIGDARFDERLVLYGWQEDIDFTSRLRRFGKIYSLGQLIGVHLGMKAGRVSGVRMGYSQIVNPTYLIRKGTMPRDFALKLVARNVTANVLKCLWPEAHVDRRGRLKGNILAAYHLLRGRIEPEHILNL